MSDPQEVSLAHRVAVLEAQVRELQRRLRETDASASPAAEAPPAAAGPADRPAGRPATPKPPPRPSQETTDRLRAVLKSEDWLNKIGIGLLLFGLIFLFKYSIDQGWLTPAVRVVFGAVLGVFLLGAGLRLRPRRLRYGQVLLGGGIATLYVTLFSAYQLYGLVSYPVAFAAMGVVTGLGFILAVQQDDAALGVIATLGGLGTPFLLYTGDSNLAGLVVYTCIVLASASGIYLYKGWRSLLLSTVVGGWLVFIAAVFDASLVSENTVFERAVFQGGVLFCWLAFGVLPVVRAVWHRRAPDAWVVPPLRLFKGSPLAQTPALGLAVVAPLVTVALSREAWQLPDLMWGVLMLGGVALYAGAYALLRRADEPRLASAHGVAAALLLVVSLFDLLDDGNLRWVALAAEGLALHALARHLADRGLRFVGHAAFAVVALGLMYRLTEQGGALPVLVNGTALADLAMLALGFAALWTLADTRLRTLYGLAAYVGLLGWFLRDLVLLSNGQAYVSVAWGLCAIAGLALGWRRDADLIRNVGLGTLLVVVAKLFVVDLSELDALWRILLFLGFGGLLLLLSYFFPSLWRPQADAAEAPEPSPDAPPPGAPPPAP